MVTIESVPAGATVQELVDGRRNGAKVYLGMTPLQSRLPDGEHTLLVSKPRAGASVVTVSPGQPTVRVVLGRGGVQRQPRGPSSQSDGQSAPDERTPEGQQQPSVEPSPAPDEQAPPEGPL